MIFDTDCVLCSGMVAFVLAHEAGPVLRFAGAWSGEGLALAARYGFSKADLSETFLVIAGDKALARSDGAIAVAARLRAPWRWLTTLRFVPRALRDSAYLFIARRRYGLFGRRDNCTIVPMEQRARFIGVADDRQHRALPEPPLPSWRGLSHDCPVHVIAKFSWSCRESKGGGGAFWRRR